MGNQYGTGHIHTLSGAAIGIASLAGYVSPNITEIRASHSGKIDEIVGQNGEITGFIATDDSLELEFNYVPEGTTVANSKLSAGLPRIGAPCTITGLAIVAIGRFTDALNTNGANTQPWFYQGQSEITGPNENKWTSRLRLKRYVNITSGNAVT